MVFDASILGFWGVSQFLESGLDELALGFGALSAAAATAAYGIYEEDPAPRMVRAARGGEVGIGGAMTAEGALEIGEKFGDYGGEAIAQFPDLITASMGVVIAMHGVSRLGDGIYENPDDS